MKTLRQPMLLLSCKDAMVRLVVSFGVLLLYSSSTTTMVLARGLEQQAQGIAYSVCSALVDNNDNIVLCDDVLGDDTAMAREYNSNCSNTNNAMCIQVLRRPSAVLDRLVCISDMCNKDEVEDNQLVNIAWGFNTRWIETCDPSCSSTISTTNDNGNNNATATSNSNIKASYQRCQSSEDCSSLGEGFCCSLPSLPTLKAVGCGPPECYGCPTTTNSSSSITTTNTSDAVAITRANDASTCQTTESCPSLNYGTCIRSDTPDIRPGYSCANNVCLDVLLWAEQVCGFHRPTMSFPSPRKTCSEACTKAMGYLFDCSSITSDTPTTSIGHTALLDSIQHVYQQYEGCRNCETSYYYHQCASSSDCPAGFCCSLPPSEAIPGFFDPSTSCGPPQKCWCDATQLDDSSFVQKITCTKECTSSILGSCIEMGTVDPRNPLFTCDCSDLTTFTRTAAPTLPVTKAPVTSYPSEAENSPVETPVVSPPVNSPVVEPSSSPIEQVDVNGPSSNESMANDTDNSPTSIPAEEEGLEFSPSAQVYVDRPTSQGQNSGAYPTVKVVQSLVVAVIGWTAWGFMTLVV